MTGHESVLTAVIRQLSTMFPGMVFRDVLPFPDSSVTAVEFPVVVSSVSDVVVREDCEITVRKSVVNIAAYQRDVCFEPDLVDAYLRCLVLLVKDLYGETAGGRRFLGVLEKYAVIMPSQGADIFGKSVDIELLYIEDAGYEFDGRFPGEFVAVPADTTVANVPPTPICD